MFVPGCMDISKEWWWPIVHTKRGLSEEGNTVQVCDYQGIDRLSPFNR
jgi:hypothetical protein